MAFHACHAGDSFCLHRENKPPVSNSADMPELPEVESARKFVEQHCEGLEIIDVTVADDDSMPPSLPSFKR